MKQAVFSAILLTCALPWNAAAQPAKGVSQKDLKALLDRIERLEAEIRKLKKDQPAQIKDAGLKILVESPFLGYTYNSSSGIRYFAARLVMINLTGKPVTIKREQIQLLFDDDKHPAPASISSRISSYSYQYGTQSIYVRSLTTPAQLRIPAGGTASAGLAIGQLPKGNDQPQLTVQVEYATKNEKRTTKVDVNKYCGNMLGLEVARMGPKKGLAIVKIDGTFNTINAINLADELDSLANQSVARVILAWSDSAPNLGSNELSWLTGAANAAGRSSSKYYSFPQIPASFREFHLAAVPNYSANSSSPPSNYYGGPKRIHKTLPEAVTSALFTAYERMPVDMVLAEIKNGSDLAKIAAVTAAGGRLPAKHLPMLLAMCDHKDPRMQRAALVSMRHFGEKSAIEKLVTYAKKNVATLSSTAISSLAASRYPAAHQALLKILQNETPESKKKIVGILAKYPRPVWSDTIYEFAQDPNSTVGAQAIRALVDIGHPKLDELLKKALYSTNSSLRDEVFRKLVSRGTEKSNKLAVEYTLKYLRTSPPTSQMYTIINRTKDSRFLPLLHKHLKSGGGSRTSLISSLTQLGDPRVEAILLEMYPRLSDYEKSSVLNSLKTLDSDKYIELAGKALYSTNSSLVSAACSGLQAEASRSAVRMLAAALEKTNYSTAWSYITNALASIGTAEARASLRKTLSSTNSSKRSYAESALQNLYSRSPGRQFVYRGKALQKEKKWKEALKNFNTAIMLDAENPEALHGRASVRLRTGKPGEAQVDAKKAYELAPWDHIMRSTYALSLVMDGKLKEGIEVGEAGRKRFGSNSVFVYNMACVYGQALQHVQKNKSHPKRGDKITEFTDKALADLERGVKKLGFRNTELFKTDEDLDGLRQNAKFKELMKPYLEPSTPTPAKPKVPPVPLPAGRNPFKN